MKPDYMSNPEYPLVANVASRIASCDFGVTVSRYLSRVDSPWIITVAEHTWCRHIVIEAIAEDGTDAFLGILPAAQSKNFGYDINLAVERHITLKELVLTSYSGVVKELKHQSSITT